jgi:membrane dipeptidase
MVLDSHNDSLVSHIRRGRRSLTGAGVVSGIGDESTVWRLRGPLPEAAYAWNGQLDFPLMRAGGIDAACFAVDVTLAWRNHMAYALDAFGFLLADLAAHPDAAVVARCAGDLVAAREGGRPGVVLAIENSDALEGSLAALHAFHGLGVRAITLTHNPSSLAAAGNGERESGGGLTRFGRALVREMNRAGVLVDVSHIAPRGFADVLEVSERPVIASHSCCAALCDHPRNLTDEQLRSLGDAGGVVGITFVPSFLRADWEDALRPAGIFERLIEHVDHAVQVAGIDHVGIGSDFDGGGTALESAAEYPRIAAALRARGYPEAAVGQVLGLNTFRVLQAAIG